MMDLNAKTLEELEMDLIMNETDLDPNDLFMENHLETIQHVDDRGCAENKNIRKIQGIMQKIKMQNILTKYQCQQCKIEVLSTQELEEHILERHGPLQCKRCKKIFTKDEDYADHIKIEHDGVEDFGEVCKDCGKRFVSKQTMKAHMLSKCGKEKHFKCDVCGQTYMSKLSLNSHKAIHDGKKYFCCSYCGKQFISQGELKVHERKHTKEKPFQCNVCHKSFPYRESLVTHSSIHTGIKPYLCILCGKTFSCVGNLLKHRRSKPESCGLPQYCQKIERVAPRIGTRSAYKADPPAEPFCPKERNDNPAFIIEEWHETIEIEEFEANWLQSDKTSEDDDTKSIAPVNETKEDVPSYQKNYRKTGRNNKKQKKKVRQEEWGNYTRKKGEYNFEVVEKRETRTEDDSENDTAAGKNEQNPVEFVDVNGSDVNLDTSIEAFVIEELYECSICNLESTSTELIDHMNKEHAVETEAFKTEQVEEEEEEENEYTDPREDPIIQCLYCEEKFFQQTEYYRHLKSHSDISQINSVHGSTDESNDVVIKTKEEVLAECIPVNYACKKCGKKCYSRSSLREHDRSQCGSIQLHQCGTCEKFYYSASSLKRHITVHSGEMPYLCSICGKPFRTKGQYVVHTRKHTGEKPYKCNLCPKAFSYRQSLVTHITTHTGEKPFFCYCGKTFSCVKNLQSHRNTFSTTCGQLPLNTKPMIPIGVIKGQLYVGEKSSV